MLVWLLLNVVVEISCWQQRQRVALHGTHFPVWWLFLVFISFSLLWMVLVPMSCFILAPFLNAIMGSVLKVFYNFDLPVICASVLLEYFSNLVALDYMVLIMVCIVYNHAFVEQLFSIELVNFPNTLYDNIFFVSFINKLFNTFTRVTECWAYLPNSKCLAVGNRNILV